MVRFNVTEACVWTVHDFRLCRKTWSNCVAADCYKALKWLVEFYWTFICYYVIGSIVKFQIPNFGMSLQCFVTISSYTVPLSFPMFHGRSIKLSLTIYGMFGNIYSISTIKHCDWTLGVIPHNISLFSCNSTLSGFIPNIIDSALCWSCTAPACHCLLPF